MSVNIVEVKFGLRMLQELSKKKIYLYCVHFIKNVIVNIIYTMPLIYIFFVYQWKRKKYW